jgi:CheY-like chemotaxis protein
MTALSRSDLSGRRILIVEDDYLIACEMAESLADCGAEIVGPAASIAQANALIASDGDRLHGAVLDLNLSGTMVFPVADALRERDIPFVFATGYDAWNVPARYADVPQCQKPADPVKISRILAG